MLGPSLPTGPCLVYVICISLHIVVSNTYCVVFCSSSCVSYVVTFFLDSPFSIAPSVFSNIYLDCPFSIAPSVFSNIYPDCPFSIALRYSLTFIFHTYRSEIVLKNIGYSEMTPFMLRVLFR